MIEVDVLLQYGILGLWTISLLAEKYYLFPKLVNAIDNLESIIDRKL